MSYKEWKDYFDSGRTITYPTYTHDISPNIYFQNERIAYSDYINNLTMARTLKAYREFLDEIKKIKNDKKTVTILVN